MLWAAVAVWNETQSDGCLVDRKLKCSYPIDELIFRSKDSFHLGLLGLGIGLFHRGFANRVRLAGIGGLRIHVVGDERAEFFLAVRFLRRGSTGRGVGPSGSTRSTVA
jgi:hypothetical protein